MKKIKLRLRSLLNHKILFFSSIFLIFISFCLLPTLSSFVVENNYYNAYSNIKDDDYFLDLGHFNRLEIKDKIEKDKYSKIVSFKYQLNDIYYNVYVSDENISEFYLPFDNLYLDVENKTLINNMFYTNCDFLNEFTFDDKLIKKSGDKLDVQITNFINNKYDSLTNFVLIIDNDFNYNNYLNNTYCFISSNVNKDIKEVLNNNNVLTGYTIKQNNYENYAMINNLMSMLLLLPLILVTVISMYVINTLYYKNKLEDKIKSLYYQKKKYYYIDNIIDFLIVYFIPMFLGIITNVIIVNIAHLNIYPLFYLMSQVVTLILFFVFVFRKRKLGRKYD